jgi:hypothetical protein
MSSPLSESTPLLATTSILITESKATPKDVAHIDDRVGDDAAAGVAAGDNADDDDDQYGNSMVVAKKSKEVETLSLCLSHAASSDPLSLFSISLMALVAKRLVCGAHGLCC